MKAIVLTAADKPLQYLEVPRPTLGPGEVLVKINAAALNRRDYWITIGKYAGIKYPSILGSDGSGVVVEAFDDEGRVWLNRDVIINPSNNYGDSADFQGKDFKILGLPDDGTLAEYVKTRAEYIYAKPKHLSWEEAAALPLAGLTAYRALFTKAKAKAGDTVLISGVGGGAGTFALQWAVAAGCRVFVTSGNAEKIDRAVQLGAIAGVNYKATDWAEQLKQLAGGFDIVIDSALGDGFAQFPDLCNPGGRMVIFGATAGNLPPLDGRKIFWKQLQLLGTTMGTKTDFEAMLTFLNTHSIKPIVDAVFALADADMAVRQMAALAQFGKIVLRA